MLRETENLVTLLHLINGLKQLYYLAFISKTVKAQNTEEGSLKGALYNCVFKFIQKELLHFNVEKESVNLFENSNSLKKTMSTFYNLWTNT